MALFFLSVSFAALAAATSKAKQRPGKSVTRLNNAEDRGRICESSYTVAGCAAFTALIRAPRSMGILWGAFAAPCFLGELMPLPLNRSVEDNLVTDLKGPRMLSDVELVDLRREMQESSAWMRAEIERRRALASPPVEQEPSAVGCHVRAESLK